MRQIPDRCPSYLFHQSIQLPISMGNKMKQVYLFVVTQPLNVQCIMYSHSGLEQLWGTKPFSGKFKGQVVPIDTFLKQLIDRSKWALNAKLIHKMWKKFQMTNRRLGCRTTNGSCFDLGAGDMENPMFWGSNALGNLHLNNLTNYSIYICIYIL